MGLGTKYWVGASTSYNKVCGQRPSPSTLDYNPGGANERDHLAVID